MDSDCRILFGFVLSKILTTFARWFYFVLFLSVLMKYTFDRTVRMVVSIVILIALVLLFNRLSSVLLPFLVGWLIAYLLHPIVSFVQYRIKIRNRAISVFLTLLSMTVIIGGLIWALVPVISAEVSKATVLVNEYLATPTHAKWSNGMMVWFDKLIGDIKAVDFMNVDNLKDAFEKLIPGVWTIISGTWQVMASMFVVFIVFLYIVFILLDYEKINEGFRSMLPLRHKKLILEIFNDVEIGMNRYFRGQSLVALIVGILFAIGFRIVGLPMGITIGLFIGLLNLVPYLQTIGIVPVILLALIQSAETGTNFWLIMGGCAIVFIVVQVTQDMFLVPKIMGRAMGLNPAIILLSLSVWGSLLGMAGMIIALPVTTLMISYYKRFVVRGEVYVPENSNVGSTDK